MGNGDLSWARSPYVRYIAATVPDTTDRKLARGSRGHVFLVSPKEWRSLFRKFPGGLILMSHWPNWITCLCLSPHWGMGPPWLAWLSSSHLFRLGVSLASSDARGITEWGGCEWVKLNFCRKDGEGVPIWRSQAAASSARSKGVGREMAIEKRKQERTDNLWGNPL